MKRFTVLFAFFVFFGVTLLHAQNVQITGVVTSDEDGSPIPGASVVVKGTTTGTTTDYDGQYSLSVPANANTLVFSFVGMQKQEVAIAGKTKIDVVLQPDLLQVDEVVVVAYGTTKRESFTGSASTVKTEKLEEIQTESVTKAIEGLAAGVQTTSGLGQPGTDATIRIRGLGSINASSSPLYVVDGAPYGGSLSSINPADIASITVLKDASATALYGSRAANGVIMITTKSGSSKGSSVNFRATYGFSDRAIPEYDRVNVPQYYELMWERLYNNNITLNGETDAAARAHASSQLIPILGGYNDYNVADSLVVLPGNGKINPSANRLWRDDWEKELFRIGTRQDYVLSASGGNEKSNYYISGNYLNAEGIVKASNYERFSVRVNVDSKMKKWMKVGMNLAGSTSSQNYPESEGTSYVNSFMFTRMIAPIYPVYVYDLDGNLVLDSQGNKQYDYGDAFGRTRAYASNSNPLGVINLDTRLYKTDILSARSYIELNFLKNFTFKVNGDVDYNSYNAMDHQNALYGDAAEFSGRSTRTATRGMTMTFNELLTWTRSFGSHSFDVLAGHENYNYKYNYLDATRTGFPFGGLVELDAAATPEGSSSYEDNFTMESYLSRLNYNYADKYYFSASYRTDGSSRFHPDYRWGNFWSVGASWRISEESFMSGISWLNTLRLKGSYGSQGNDRIGTYYAYLGLFATGYNNINYPGLIASRLATPQLKWEKNNSLNIGLDVKVFDRVGVNLEYYVRSSKDLLFQQPLAPSTGFDSYDANIGALQNKGFDLEVNAAIIHRNNFSWLLDLNLTHYKNEITKLPQKEMIVGTKKYMVGHSIYDFYLRKSAGVDPDNGHALWYYDELQTDGSGNVVYDDNGDPVKTGKMLTTDVYGNADRYYVGTAIPDLMGGVTNSFKIYNFDLSVLLTYAVGGKVLDQSYQGLMHAGQAGDNWHTDILNRWQKPGDVTDVPVLDNDQNANGTSDRFLFDAGYLSVRNVTLGYNLPKSMVEKIGMTNAKVFATATNLYTKTSLKGMDPRQSLNGLTSNAYTPLRTIAFGLNLNF